MYAPVVEFEGTAIDLEFVRLSMQTISENLDLGSNSCLQSLARRCVQRLNGCRVTDKIHLVSDSENLQLSSKLWAKCRSIYSSIWDFSVGFPGQC